MSECFLTLAGVCEIAEHHTDHDPRKCAEFRERSAHCGKFGACVLHSRNLKQETACQMTRGLPCEDYREVHDGQP